MADGDRMRATLMIGAVLLGTDAMAQVEPPLTLDPVGETIAQAEEDVNALSVSLVVDLARALDPEDGTRVFRTEDGFVRRFGAISAEYRFGEYTTDEDGRLIPLPPAGTVYRIGSPEALTPGRPSDLGAMTYVGALEADLSAHQPRPGESVTRSFEGPESEARAMPWSSERSRADRIARLLRRASEA